MVVVKESKTIIVFSWPPVLKNRVSYLLLQNLHIYHDNKNQDRKIIFLNAQFNLFIAIDLGCSIIIFSPSHALFWSSSNISGINFETFLKDNKFKYFFPWVNNMHDRFDRYTRVTPSVINEPVTWFIKKKEKTMQKRDMSDFCGSGYWPNR